MNKSESKYFNTAKKMDEAFISLLDKKSFDYITVKEICQKAGVHRSTFYLHYETIDDLLCECNQYIIDKFLSAVDNEAITRQDIENLPIEDLHFITPKYLLPWLTFIQKNKRLFSTYLYKFAMLTGEKNNKLLFHNVLNPVLERFQVNERERPYILHFYIEGIMAIVKYWVACGCKEDVEQICKIIVNCVYYEKMEGNI